MEIIGIVLAILVLVFLTRIIGGLSSLGDTFKRIERRMDALSADIAAIRKQGDGVLPPAPLGHPPSRRGEKQPRKNTLVAHLPAPRRGCRRSRLGEYSVHNPH